MGQFDLDTLTCIACNKSFKNTRAFKLHRDRHQGLLNHKCPDCSKTFNGRSEVNRHMLAIHHRSLKPDEQNKIVSPVKSNLNDVSINHLVSDLSNSSKSQTQPSVSGMDTQGHVKQVIDTSIPVNPLLNHATTSSTHFVSQKLIENPLNEPDDKPSFDGDVTPILESDSDEDCYVINEDEVPTKTLP